MSSEQLAQFLEARAQDGRDVAFCIGGPDGLAPEIDARADLRWSLSALTLPHALARVVVAEALYRAVSIIKGIPITRDVTVTGTSELPVTSPVLSLPSLHTFILANSASAEAALGKRSCGSFASSPSRGAGSGSAPAAAPESDRCGGTG